MYKTLKDLKVLSSPTKSDTLNIYNLTKDIELSNAILFEINSSQRKFNWEKTTAAYLSLNQLKVVEQVNNYKTAKKLHVWESFAPTISDLKHQSSPSTDFWKSALDKPQASSQLPSAIEEDLPEAESQYTMFLKKEFQ